MKKLFSLSIVLTIAFLITNCSKPTKKFNGKVIQIDYSNVEAIKDSSWIKVDGWKFMHFRSVKIGKQNEYSLPASYAILNDEDERPVGTDINSYGMGLYIARNLNDINKTKLKDNSPKFRIINPRLISVKGIIKIAKTDSSSFSIEVPTNYPAKIKAFK